MIEQIDIINLSHYDLGFTDHPAVCRMLQTRYLDQAIDLVVAFRAEGPARRFSWTVESNNVLLEWWREATVARRDLLVELVHAGEIEVCAMPFNHAPGMDAREWRCCAHWMPEDLWQAMPARTIMQNDVNGFPRAGAMAFLDRGAEFLWMGLNRDTGGTPVPQPSAFWWRMPDGRRLFVWNAETYPNGYFLFEPAEWRRGPLPPAADTRYRPPRRGEILSTSPENLLRAHAICCARLATWAGQGYALPRVAVSMTNMWRVDNDPPCAQLPEFIAAWNAAGLVPRLAMSTPTPALSAIREAAGGTLPVLEGEWTDWWANGAASTPREVAASRQAKRVLDALDSPLYRSLPGIVERQDRCTRELCFFDEHTWGSWNSVALPGSLDTRGQFAEKGVFAHRSLALAELTLGEANRAIAPDRPGIHVINPSRAPFTGWVTLPADCLRGTYAGALDETTGDERAFDPQPGVSAFFTTPTRSDQFSPLDESKVFPDQIAGRDLRLWVEAAAPASIRSFTLRKTVMPRSRRHALVVTDDDSGWPTAAAWEGRRLFSGELGAFWALAFHGLAPRWAYKEILAITDAAERRAARSLKTTLTPAVPRNAARVTDTGPTLRYVQDLEHPRLGGMRRAVELYKHRPHARLTVTILRRSQPDAAEIFYLALPVYAPDSTVSLTNGGLAFRPDSDQIPRTCRDYFAIDGRVVYAGTEGETVVDLHETSLVALGGIADGLLLERLEGDPTALYAMLYNNIWYTNFAGDEAGRMDFTVDLYRPSTPGGAAPYAWAVVNATEEGGER
jgi:hypothetical protein